MPIEVKGAKELGAFFADCPNLGRESTRSGLVKASGRLRTLIRRAAPTGKTGNLKKSVGSWVSPLRKNTNPMARIGLKTRYYYKTLEYGRRAHKRNGKPVAGSPEMARFAFLWKAIRTHESQFLQDIITESRTQFYKAAGRAAVRMGAPIRVRG